jgi:Domain of unknown function (DUF4402)
MRGAPKRYSTRLSVALAAALTTLCAPAQAETYAGDAQVALIQPLSFIAYRDLDFGRVIPAAVAGTVTISPAGVRSTTNGVVPIGNDFQVARFAGMGTQNQRVRIQVTPNTITLTGPGPAMTVTAFTIGPAPTLQQIGASPNYRIQPADGIFWFTVGGTLNVGANQPGGAYSGTFTATLDYQ